MDLLLPSVVISRDGRLSLQLLEVEGPYAIPNRDAHGLWFVIRLSPTASRSRLAVIFSGDTYRYSSWEKLGYPETADKELRLHYFAQTAIGEYLDTEGLPPPTGSGVSAFQIECFSPMFNAWEKRPRANDEEILAYLEAKLVWGWKYEQPYTEYSFPDFLRLHATIQTVARVAQLGYGQMWEDQVGSVNTLGLVPTPDFLRARAKPSQQGRSAGEHLLSQLQAPRYNGPREHWLKALDFAQGSKRDLANAAKEAICAVEGMARVLTGDHSGTLGELIKALKATTQLDPALARLLETLWGFTSNAPGVRHGAAVAISIEERETQFVIDTAQAALRLLMEMDT